MDYINAGMLGIWKKMFKMFMSEMIHFCGYSRFGQTARFFLLHKSVYHSHFSTPRNHPWSMVNMNKRNYENSPSLEICWYSTWGSLGLGLKALTADISYTKYVKFESDLPYNGIYQYRSLRNMIISVENVLKIQMLSNPLCHIVNLKREKNYGM